MGSNWNYKSCSEVVTWSVHMYCSMLQNYNWSLKSNSLTSSSLLCSTRSSLCWQPHPREWLKCQALRGHTLLLPFVGSKLHDRCPEHSSESTCKERYSILIDDFEIKLLGLALHLIREIMVQKKNSLSTHLLNSRSIVWSSWKQRQQVLSAHLHGTTSLTLTNCCMSK